MSPLFSIITITYNAAAALPPTMASVKEQTFAGYEHIIVDGASTDDTVAVARRWSTAATRVISEPDRGLYDAMNKGLRAAAGRYLIFLNAGDAFASRDVLERAAALADNNPGVIYGQTRIVDSDRRVIGPRHLTAPEKLTAGDFSRGMLVCHQAFIARRDIAGEYDLRYRFSADYDWCVRCLKNSPANAYLGDEPIIDYLAEGVTTRNHRASLLERFRVMCRHYGTACAVARHITFIPRYLRRAFN